MALTDPIPVPAGINPGVHPASQATMLQLLGSPRQSYDDTCQPVTNAALSAHMVLRSVGPFRVTGYDKAVDSLTSVFAEVAAARPDLHAALGTEGMLCARLVRGSTVSISNHAWGTAIDLKLDGVLDRRGDGLCQRGLAELAPFFNRRGWYWGAGFRTEDAMHFEASEETIRSWMSAGPAVTRLVSLGDRGPAVAAIQQRLQALGFECAADGIYGRGTMAQIMAFQTAQSLPVDGVVRPETAAALGVPAA